MVRQRSIFLAAALVYSILFAAVLAAPRIAAGSAPALLASGISYAAGSFLILFLPGLAWAAYLHRREAVSFGEALLTSFGVSFVFHLASTTLVKISGRTVEPVGFLAIGAAGAAAGFAAARLAGVSALRVEEGTARRHTLLLGAAAAGFALLVIAYRGYFFAPEERFWAIRGNPINPLETEEVAAWTFPEVGARPAVAPAGGIRALPERRYETGHGPAMLSITNPLPRPIAYPCKWFLLAERPGRYEFTLDGKRVKEGGIPILAPVARAKRLRRPYRAAVSFTLVLPPGTSTLALRSDASPVLAEDYSGLSRADFSRVLARRYMPVQIGPVFDTVEVLDIGGNFRTKLFTYTEDLRAGRPGYTLANQPLTFYMDMLGFVLWGIVPSSERILYVARSLPSYLAIVLLAGLGFRKPPRTALLLLPLLPILAEYINLVNFGQVEATDLTELAFLLPAAYFLLRRKNGWFLLFALLTAASRNHGALLTGFLLGGAFAFHGHRTDVARSGARWILLCALYFAAVIAAVHLAGDLDIARQDFFSENLQQKFQSVPGARWIDTFLLLISWYLLTAGFTPLLIPFARDHISWVLAAVVAAYIALISNVCFIKPYYLITPILFTCPIAVRAIHELRDRAPALRLGRMRIAPDTAAACLFLVVGALCLAHLVRVPLAFSDSLPRW